MGGVAGAAWGDVFNLPAGETSLSLVTVGDPGNAPDTTGFGAVPYTYSIGEYDVTVAQYTQMLNSVAQTDPNGLWNGSMSPGSTAGSCGIVRAGVSGTYSYSYAAGNANFPVNGVSWFDAARFCNWLANGQPATGVENATTTESGSYTLDGVLPNMVTRSPSATYVIPTENEWYKSAYYDGSLNGGSGGYWLYPTRSNTPPSNVLSAIGDDNANFRDPTLGFTDPVNLLTPVGEFSDSPSFFQTFDQGGDVAQILGSPLTGIEIRGGGWTTGVSELESNARFSGMPTGTGPDIGFRVGVVPEPSSVGMLFIAAVGLLQRRRAR
jgi:hypothetical protein